MELSHYEKYGRKCYHKNKAKYASKRKAWDTNNRQKRVGYVQAYVTRNKEKVAAYNRQFGQSLAGKYRLIIHRHKKRGWTDPVLTLNEFAQISSGPCFYCDADAKHGLDRVDNARGYSKDNVVPCCKPCNYMKKDLTQSDFLAHVRRIAAHN